MLKSKWNSSEICVNDSRIYYWTFLARMLLTLRSNCCSICCSSSMEHDPKPSPKSFLRHSKFQIQTCFSDSEKRSMCVWEKENQVRLEPFGNFKKLYLLCHICCFMLQMLRFQTNTIHEKIKKNLFIRFHSCKECSGEERKMWNLLGHITETIIDKNDIEKATVSLTLQSSTLSDGDARF